MWVPGALEPGAGRCCLIVDPLCPQDEQSTLQLLKKHLQLEQGVENYEESIAQLSRQCRALLEMGHPDRWTGGGVKGGEKGARWGRGQFLENSPVGSEASLVEPGTRPELTIGMGGALIAAYWGPWILAGSWGLNGRALPRDV